MIDISKAIEHLLAEFNEILLDGLLLMRGLLNLPHYRLSYKEGENWGEGRNFVYG
jgi:hypothetical protein